MSRSGIQGHHRRAGWSWALGLTLAFAACGDDGIVDPPGTGDENNAPVASAGADQTVTTGLAVTLDGSASSDPDGDAITFSWSLAVPSGSSAALDDASSVTPSFTPDVDGAYVATLTVDDGTDSDDASTTLTAEDGTAASTVTAAGGGEVESSDGLFTLAIPAGALAEDTEIRITRYAPSQFPESAGQVSGVSAAYDLQPSGLTFASPAEVRFAVADAFQETSNGLEVQAALLYSESGGVVEAMGDIVLEPSEEDSTDGIVSGRLDHFSSAFVTRPQGLALRIDGPGSWEAVDALQENWDDYPIGTTFDGIVSVLTADSPFPGFTAITQVDESVAPVLADPDFEAALLDEGGGIFTGVNAFVCSEVGTGRLAARVRIEVDDDFESIVTVPLSRSVSCTPPPVPLGGTYVAAPLATNLVNRPEVGAMTFGGSGARDIALSTAMIDEYAFEDFNTGDRANWVNRMADGSFLAHAQLGRTYWVDHLGDSIGGTVNAYDQPRDTYQPTPDVTLIASAFGDLGIMDYAGGGTFTDRRRQLDPTQQFGKQSDDQILQVWGTSDLSTILGLKVEGNGDAAVQRSEFALLQSELGSFADLDGRVMVDFFDAPYRHHLDLECVEDGAQSLLCAFSAGNPDPRGNFGTAEDGYFVIFSVDLATNSISWTWRYIGGPARAGASIFPSGDGEAHVVAVVNQDTAELELYRIEDGIAVDDTAIQLEGETLCIYPVDMAYNGLADKLALICEGSPGDGRGILVIEGIRGHVEGF